MNPRRDERIGLPGGGVGKDEEVLDAAIREIKEETSVTINRGEMWYGGAQLELNRDATAYITKHICIATIPMSRARTERFNPSYTKNEQPHGNGGEVALLARRSEMPHIFFSPSFIDAHREYLNIQGRDYLQKISQGKLILP
jgi:8-oxo-dGTP pyrophosphatase MutT (NUDIX family)